MNHTNAKSVRPGDILVYNFGHTFATLGFVVSHHLDHHHNEEMVIVMMILHEGELYRQLYSPDDMVMNGVKRITL